MKKVPIEKKRPPVGVVHVKTEIESQPAATNCKPLANSNEPTASPLSVARMESELHEADSVAAYISQIQAGEKPATFVASAGTSLADQLAQFTAINTDELVALLGPETN